jgi:hypothetical protein
MIIALDLWTGKGYCDHYRKHHECHCHGVHPNKWSRHAAICGHCIASSHCHIIKNTESHGSCRHSAQGASVGQIQLVDSVFLLMLPLNNIRDVDVCSLSGIQTTLQITLKMEKKSWSIELQSLWTYAKCCSSADTRCISPTPAWLRDLFHYTKRVCFTNSKRIVLSKHWCLLKPMQMDEEVGY